MSANCSRKTSYHNLALLFITLSAVHTQCSAYKHIIFMHGLFGSEKEFDYFKGLLDQVHPGTGVTTINLFDGDESLLNPMWKQVDAITSNMSVVMSQHPEGVHLLCYSQGGLLCRAIIQTMSSHNVVNFISLSAPLAGQFGDTSSLSPWVPSGARRVAYLFFYTKDAQKSLSIANYWNDPYHYDMYLKYSDFLAVLNNETTVKHNHTFSPAWKKNFSRLQNLVLIGGPDDGVITPWQSALFGFYKDNDTNVVDMEQTALYREDSFGLRTLHESGRISTSVVSGVKHTEWHSNKTVFTDHILKWLT